MLHGRLRLAEQGSARTRMEHLLRLRPIKAVREAVLFPIHRGQVGKQLLFH
nr:MAG TPA: hypothetical protein [Caudoviricetes sp.]